MDTLSIKPPGRAPAHQGGLAPEHRQSVLSGLGGRQRRLLLSEGLLTEALEHALGRSVTLELGSVSRVPLDAETISYLDLESSEARGGALKREVWLSAKDSGGGKPGRPGEDQRLVFARTLVPLGAVDQALLGELEYGQTPLGRLLAGRGMPFVRDSLAFGLINEDRASYGFGSFGLDFDIDRGSKLYARRYRVLNKDGSGRWLIKAAITEVFNDLFSPDVTDVTDVTGVTDVPGMAGPVAGDGAITP